MKNRIFVSIMAGAALLTGCSSDWRDGIAGQDDAQPISFTTTVVSSRQQTRADASIVNLHETHLPATADYCVGVFAAHTGSNSWSDATPTANMMFNQRMTVGKADGDGANPLSYYATDRQDSLQRFWPNKSGDKVSFWAYYPWNAAADPGDRGISITATGMTSGMGSVKFTMHSNTSEQNDFMMSDLVVDQTKPALTTSGSPDPVQFRLRHLLAQVRLYAFLRGTDKLVYTSDNYTAKEVAEGKKFKDEYGVERDATTADYKINEAKSVRWERSDVLDVTGRRYRTTAQYTISFNNIHRAATFTPKYDAATGTTTFTYKDEGSLGSATVDTYVMNPYWFRFDEKGERVMLNDNYMYGYFEDTPAAKGEKSADNIDGIDWSEKGKDYLKYAPDTKPLTNDHLGSGKHYNYAPCNIILAVPQVMDDDDVPHVVITAKGKDTHGNPITARVTINMLQMNLKWESGFIYSYAFIDNDLHPGDDKVKGPESIKTVFDISHTGDQW